MKVKNKDLVGEIANLPKRVVQAMVDEQVRQGNKADPSVFAANDHAGNLDGGFDWYKSEAGADFWEAVIVFKKFDLIPKPEKPKGHIHAKLMKQYAKDAAISETPWEFWEYQPYGSTRWHELTDHLRWCPLGQYRRKGTTESEAKPTPHEIIQAMLAKGMTVWVACSDYCYESSRERIGKHAYKIIAIKEGTDSPVQTATVFWRYAVPVDLATMTEITELP